MLIFFIEKSDQIEEGQLDFSANRDIEENVDYSFVD